MAKKRLRFRKRRANRGTPSHPARRMVCISPPIESFAQFQLALGVITPEEYERRRRLLDEAAARFIEDNDELLAALADD